MVKSWSPGALEELGRRATSSQSHHETDESREPKLEKNSSALFTTETRSTRRCTENPDASVKPPCPPCLRGETGRVAAARHRLNRSVVNRSDSGASGKRARGDTEVASAEAAAWIRPDPASVRRNLQHRPRTTERVLRLSRYAGPRICRRGCAVGRPPIDRKARRR